MTSTRLPDCSASTTTWSVARVATTIPSDFVQARTVIVPFGLWMVTMGRASTLKWRWILSAEAGSAPKSNRLGTSTPATFQLNDPDKLHEVLIGPRRLP